METTVFKPEEQLHHNLKIVEGHLRRPPQQQDSQGTTTQKTYLPGNPRIGLDDASAIASYLQRELLTPDLNKLSPHLWLVAKQDSSHISPLTEQLVRGRGIIVTERPELHLVWFDNHVFLKPLPKYLLSHAFWSYYLASPTSPIPTQTRHELTQAAYGLLRSYAYLIQHKSDYLLATRQETRLISPKITYGAFTQFINRCYNVSDDFVSPRYHFGELRLTRLNFWSRVFLGKLNYQKVEWQYGAYFARYYAPILFVFGVFSVLLSAMQLVIAVQGVPDSSSGSPWWTFAAVSRNFSIFTLIFVAGVTACLVSMVLVLAGRELMYALNDLVRKAWGRRNKGERLDINGSC
ncbi:hypothetical protein BO83DRAFT_417931 [Aspergillus eucalypticola CBS 122712]|uniref:Subtilisin-like serine protease n=1 Tax=Aspergillus eucalypticola (strain CBS 122712 / IBT 29274) TaxID=1448314 RepID=A0A317VAJ0_ASPEC|nr:uncharacterized protein BO83DRAFT_417931 [Aspergillus eucalypticola CBS 122712]PWY71354.1 hypothetical protein BO83DRAFT_417931 [Aspergillus eucalypticola CBS 122712]